MVHFNGDEVSSKKRPIESDASSRSSTSDESTRHRSKRKDKKNGKKSSANGTNGLISNRHLNGFQTRRDSLGKAARDPRDEPLAKKPKKLPGQETPRTSSPPPVIESDGLSRPSLGTRQRLNESEEEAKERLEKMRGAVRTILECVGEDPDREGLLDTPGRYAKALLEFTRGYQVNVESIVNNALFHEGHNEMVIIKDIEVFSLCEHHMVPFTGKMHIGYIPSDTVIGLSKLPRIAEMYARRLQIQERLTKDVAHAIMEILKPQGVAVVMESSHLCMVMRGVEKTTTSTITSCVLGCFERKSKTRNEFLSLVGVNRTL